VFVRDQPIPFPHAAPGCSSSAAARCFAASDMTAVCFCFWSLTSWIWKGGECYRFLAVAVGAFVSHAVFPRVSFPPR
jgi:hypothetical protein